MFNPKLKGLLAVLGALTVFFGGMLIYKLVDPWGSRSAAAAGHATTPSTRTEGVGIQGRVEIRVYNDAGRLVTTWNGHNALGFRPKNAIAVCLSGASTAPAQYGSCGQEINRILMCPDSGGACAEATSTNSLLPSGCDSAASACSGWQSNATLDILQTSAYSTAQGGFRTVQCCSFLTFDTIAINPALNLAQGDRAVVTISFTVG